MVQGYIRKQTEQGMRGKSESNTPPWCLPLFLLHLLSWCPSMDCDQDVSNNLFLTKLFQPWVYSNRKQTRMVTYLEVSRVETPLFWVVLWVTWGFFTSLQRLCFWWRYVSFDRLKRPCGKGLFVLPLCGQTFGMPWNFWIAEWANIWVKRAITLKNSKSSDARDLPCLVTPYCFLSSYQESWFPPS